MSALSAWTSRPASRYRLGAAGLLFLCLFLFFWRLGGISLFDLDEGLYVTCARQMIVSGDYITPRLNSRPLYHLTATTVPFFQKPILVYWAAAASMRLFGLSEGAARLPSALVALLTTWVIVWVGTRWFGRRAGLLAGMVYAAAPMTIVDARQMTTDGLLVLWFTIALLAFWASYHTARDRRSWRFPLLFWSMCGLAVLTKGAVGLLLPAMVIGLYLLLETLALRLRLQHKRDLTVVFRLAVRPLTVLGPALRSLRPLAGLLLCFVLAAPWHYLIWKAAGRDALNESFVQVYLIEQHLGRFKGLDAVHNAPLPTYFVYFLLGFFPWACFTIAAFRRQRLLTTEGAENTQEDRKRDAACRDSVETPAADRSRNEEAIDPPIGSSEPLRDLRVLRGLDPERFLLVWFWTLFVFFSAGAAKLPTYIVPAYPAAALLVGRWLDRALMEPGDRKVARSLWRGSLGAAVTTVLLAAAAVAAPRLVPANAPIPEAVTRVTLHLTALLLTGCVLALLCFARGAGAVVWRKAGIGVLVATIVGVVGVGCTEGYRVVERHVLEPYQGLAKEANADAKNGVPVFYYRIVMRRPSMLFYADYSPIETDWMRPYLADYVRPDADVITSEDNLNKRLLPELAASPAITAHILDQKGARGAEWVLVRLHRAPY